MNDKLLKRIIIIAMSLIIAIIMIIVALLYFNKSATIDNPSEDSSSEMTIEDYANFFEKEGDYSFKRNVNASIEKGELYAIDDGIKKYLDIINTKNTTYYGYDSKGNYIMIVNQDEINKNLYNVLSKNYISKNSLTEKDAFRNINKIEELYLYSIVEAEKITDNNVKSFAVHILVQSMDNYKLLQNLYLVVNIDSQNSTFSIEPLVQRDDINNVKTENKLENIEKNEYNEVSYASLSDSDMIRKYINIFKRVVNVNPNFIYSKLDSKYKEKRFTSIEKFNEYIKKNYSNIEKLNITKYLKKEYQEYSQYVCLDSNGNYIYINETSPMEYTYILDNHTIDTDEFIEKYDNAKTNVKVGMNADKIIDAIKTYDYEYIYSKLNDTFKKNNFNTIEKFEQYMKQSIYQNVETEYIDYSDEGQTSIYKIKIMDKDNENAKARTMTIIMQLKENRDFVMSFSME